VRGKLVEQDPNDEPASVLLERIAEEKARLVKEGKIKKPKSLPEITEEQKPFELPEGWLWSRLSDVLRVINGRAYKKHEMLQEGTPLLRVGNLFTSNEWYYSDLELEDDKYIDYGDLIYAWSASFGPFIWNGDRAIYHYHIWKLELYDSKSIDKYFIYNYLKSVTEKIKASGSGIAMIHMTKAKMEEIFFPFPPLEEQQRIVQRVDDLMALCDRLEQQVGDQLEVHEVLVDTLLDTLNHSANAAEVAENWARIAENFDTLFTTDASIDKLKQAILQLAVMGRLVEQDHNDEPASVLLERIANEKARLVKAGKIKKTKKLPDDIESDKPFSLPRGWQWVSIANTGITSTGKTPSTKVKSHYDGDIPFIGPGQISPSGQINTPDKFISEEGILESDEALPGDIVVVCIGGSIGKCAKIKGRCGFNQQINKIRPIIAHPDYLLSALSTDFIQKTVLEKSTGSATPIINRSKWESMCIPLPPINEQHRIVDKVEELMAFCDQLKTRLGEAGKTRTQLAEAVVEQAVN